MKKDEIKYEIIVNFSTLDDRVLKQSKRKQEAQTLLLLRTPTDISMTMLEQDTKEEQQANRHPDQNKGTCDDQ